MQRYLTLIIALLIIYNLMAPKWNNYSSSTNINQASNPASLEAQTLQHPDLQLDPAAEGGGFIEKSIAKIIVNVIKTPEGERLFYNLIQPMQKIPENKLDFKVNNLDLLNSLFNIKIIKAGYGAEVVCGDKVKIFYSYKDLNDQLIESSEKILNIGSGVEQNLENALIGMRLGEEREAIIDVSTSSVNRLYKVYITLEQIINSNSIISELKIFDDTLSFTKPILCGEKVKFDINIIDLKGLVHYQEQNLSLKVGEEGLPSAITQGLFNKTLSSTRTIITKGAYLRNNTSQLPALKKSNIKSDHYYMMEIKNTEILSK